MLFQIVMYLRMCLAYNAGVVPRLESTQAMQEQAPVIAKYVKQLLQQQSHKGKGPVQTYIELIKNLLSAIGGKSETRPCAVKESLLVKLRDPSRPT